MPSKPNKGKHIVIEDSPDSPTEPPHKSDPEDSSQSEGAPEGGFDYLNISSPESSPERYEHPKIEPWEEDLDWSRFPEDELSPRRVENIKKKADRLSCVDQDSYISWDELEWIRDYYHMEGK